MNDRGWRFWDTARETTIQYKGPRPSRELIEAILQRMGCVIDGSADETVRGLLPASGMNWGQEIEVKIGRDTLHVSSSFSATQIIGGGTNEENVSRFRSEWAKRAQYEATLADPMSRLALKAKEQDSARSMAVGGWIAVGLGVALALILLFVPSAKDRPGGKWRVAPFVVLALGYGIPRVLAASKRSRG